MTTTTLRRTGMIAAVTATLALGLAACGEDENTDSSASDTSSSASDNTDMTDDAGSDTFGEGCKLIPADGKGSFNGMATDPVATAASNNPLLKTLVTAVGEAGLVDTLNSAEALTVFAPTDDAFAKIPADTLKSVLADKETLTSILTYHVVGKRLAPADLAGSQETLQGGTVDVEGSGDAFTVNGANVLCGNIQTANATVYVIDTVLMPAA